MIETLIVLLAVVTGTLASIKLIHGDTHPAYLSLLALILLSIFVIVPIGICIQSAQAMTVGTLVIMFCVTMIVPER